MKMFLLQIFGFLVGYTCFILARAAFETYRVRSKGLCSGISAYRTFKFILGNVISCPFIKCVPSANRDFLGNIITDEVSNKASKDSCQYGLNKKHIEKIQKKPKKVNRGNK